MAQDAAKSYQRYAAARDEKKMLDSEVARTAGISQVTLSEWKNGRSMPKFDKMSRIASAVGITIAEIYG